MPAPRHRQCHVEAPQVENVDKAAHVSQTLVIETIERIVDAPHVKQVEVPHATTVEKHVEVPHMQTGVKVEVVPMMGDSMPGKEMHNHNHAGDRREQHTPEVIHV